MSAKAIPQPWAVQFRLPFWPIALLTLWDFYYVAIRPFDQLAVIVFFLFAMAQMSAAFDFARVTKIALLFCLALWVILVGAFQHADAWKPSAGMIEGIVAAAIVAACRWEKDGLIRGIGLLILVHGLAEVIQIAGYLSFHYVLNYQAWLGSEVRSGAGGLGIRATGLFQEPAAFSLIMFSLLSLYSLLGGKNAKLELFGLFCIGASISLWGWGAAAIYLVMFRPKWALVALPIVGIAGSYLFATIATSDGQSNLVTHLIINRLVHLGTDSSAASRYSALSHFDLADPLFWFGQGITDNYEIYGANGISFLLAAAGLLGMVPFVVAISWVLPAGNRIRGLACILFMLTAASQWTFVWWYVWIALASFA